MNANIAHRAHSTPPPFSDDPEPHPGSPPVDPDEGPLPLPMPEDRELFPVVEPPR